MHNMVTIVNNTVFHIWKLLKILEDFITRKKNSWSYMCMDVKYVTGESQFWLHVKTVSLICFPFFFVIIMTHNGLPQRILPLCLTVKLTCLCSEPCPSVDGRREEIKTYPRLRLAILGDICKINGFFTLFPHLSSSLIHRRIWNLDPIRWSYWDISLPSAQVVLLTSTPHFWFISLSCSKQRKLALSNK